MHRIGIFSGSFDPPHNGHLQVIAEARKLFDKLYVMIGPNRHKTPLFEPEARLEMLSQILDKDIEIGILDTGVKTFAQKLCDEGRGSVTLVRGIRGYIDLHYEQRILDKPSKLQTVFIVHARSNRFISSSNIKDLVRHDKWDYLGTIVPDVTLQALKGIAVDEAKRRERIEHDPLPPDPDNVHKYFGRLVDKGIISLKQTLSPDEVRLFMEPYPYDLVCSESFHLTKIPIDFPCILGSRHLSSSQSVGPIILDVNQSGAPKMTDIGPTLVLDGKHRLLDARRRGDKEIWAWVGDKVILP